MPSQYSFFAIILIAAFHISPAHASLENDVQNPNPTETVTNAEADDYVLGQIQLLEDMQPDEVDANLAQSSFFVQIASNSKEVPGVEKKSGCRMVKGIASVYGLNHGKGDGAHQKLSGGGHLNVAAMTAAMLVAPMKTFVEVVNMANGKTAKVFINDHGPYVRGRIIDCTPATARALGFSGLTRVAVKVCKR